MAKLVDLPTFSDARGSLTVLEQAVPFSIKRVYFISGAVGLRGGHRHKKNRQILVAVAGSCEIFVNDGKQKKTYYLDSPSVGLLLKLEDWHTMDKFSPGCVLLVLASEPYDVDDYIDEPYPA
jgi:hypothetical protein